MTTIRYFLDNAIEWEGNGVYALVSDPEKYEWKWVHLRDSFLLVEATLMNGQKIDYVYECNTLQNVAG